MSDEILYKIFKFVCAVAFLLWFFGALYITWFLTSAIYFHFFGYSFVPSIELMSSFTWWNRFIFLYVPSGYLFYKIVYRAIVDGRDE